jgi:hypothetical protein
MAGGRQAIELALSDEDVVALTAISRSRREPACRVRAGAHAGLSRRSLVFRGGTGCQCSPSDRRALRRKGTGLWSDGSARRSAATRQEPTITAEAKTWVVNLACRKAKELGYPHELWTTRLLARHVREHGPGAGHTSLAKLAQGTLCKILNEQEIKPHKVPRTTQLPRRLDRTLRPHGLGG